MRNTQDIKNTIKYNNNVINNKNTDVIVKPFKEPGNKSENVAIFILRYNLEENGENTQYEVVLGKIQLRNDSGNLIAKAKVVRDCILQQLKENNKKQNNYEYIRTLMKLCKKNSIPFIFTDEGIEIATNDLTNTKVIERTYRIQESNTRMELICLNPNKKMDLYESEINIRKSIDEKIKSHKLMDYAMREIQDEKKREGLVKAKRINDLRNETSAEVIIDDRRIAVVNWLIHQYRYSQNEAINIADEPKLSIGQYLELTRHLKENNIDKKIDPSMVIGGEEKKSNAEKYFRLKEKGIAIDIRKMLEDSQNETIEWQLENAENIEEIERQNAKENYINNCKTIFDFIKLGKDVNTQFCYANKIDGFEQLYSIVDEQKDKKDENGNNIYNSEEILEYLKLKEKILNDIKLGRKKSFLDYELYTEHDIIKEFMKFVMNSEVRKDTRKQEKDMLLEMYQEMVKEIIKSAQFEIELYNKYAERFNLDACPIPEVEKRFKPEFDGNDGQGGRE